MFGEGAEVVVDILGGDFESVVQSLSFGHFGEGGSGGDGGGATVSFPFDVCNRIGFGVDFEVHFHLVATDRVTDGAASVILEFRLVAH